MPELPEVETVMRGLAPAMVGRVVTHAEIFRADLRIPFPDHFVERLTEKRITGISRRSKYLLLALCSGEIWVVHLGMSGVLRLQDGLPETLPKHTHMLAELDSGQVLTFTDPRRFGLMALVENVALAQHPLFCHLGPEPLSEDFTVADFAARLSRRQSAIKQVVMDAAMVVGVGNIYASESLFLSGIHPAKKAKDLSGEQVARLHAMIRHVLTSAIESGGSTLRDFMHSSGDPGYFQHRFQVYGRKGEPCFTCKTPIGQMVQQNRSSFFCPQCQQ